MLSWVERANCVIAHISAKPAISPPMWPPIEIPGTANVNTRLITISARIWPFDEMIPRRSSAKSAPKTPKIAPEAPAVGALGVTISAPADPAIPEAR